MRDGGRPSRCRAVFLDRDGTLTEPRHYPSHPDDLVLQPGIGAPLRALQRRGYALVVVTNQSAVARGLFTMDVLNTMHVRLRTLLERHRVSLDGIYACPHHPAAPVPEYRTRSECRKPAPGMLERAALDLQIDLTQSWTVGDSHCDAAAGHAAGTRTAIIGHAPTGNQPPDMRCSTIRAALYRILLTD